MKRTLLLTILIVLSLPLCSQNTLTILQKDGLLFNIGLEDKPVITYSDSALVIKTAKTVVSYPLSNVSKFTFTENSGSNDTGTDSTGTDSTATDMTSVAQGKSYAHLELDNYFVSISGEDAGVMVMVVASNGEILVSRKTDSEGNTTFSIADLPNGLYVIKSPKLTCKIQKK